MTRDVTRLAIACVASLLAIHGAASGSPGDPAGSDAVTAAQVDRLIELLDSDEFATRRDAASQIEALCERPELGLLLAERFHRALVAPGISFEVRSRLEGWLPRLPRRETPPDADVSPDELDRLVEQLDDDSFAVRTGAERRLDWLLGNPKLVEPLAARLKVRLVQPARPGEETSRLEACWDRVRGAWLAAGAPDAGFPPVPDEDVARWIDALARPGDPRADAALRAARRAARRELLDAMARDGLAPRILVALETKRGETPDARAAAALDELIELGRPAMVAEYWEDRRHLGEQHLLVGVPSQSEGAARPSHFDAIDDHVARCVSGNTLEPGEYPVGVAFPHPQRENAFFRLVNLPTPRRRMAYAYEARMDDAVRLRALSRPTLDRLAARGDGLSEAELVMLAQLDPGEVSRFAGEYLRRVKDEQLPPGGMDRLGGRPSRHGLLCGILAREGAKEAGPGLVDAIRRGAFLPPTSIAPYRLHYLAAFAIARRDPWPGAEDWLAAQIDTAEPLAENRPEGPDVGATAAAMLMARHGQALSEFHLRGAPEALLLELDVEGFRFADDAGRRKAIDWWKTHPARAASVVP